MSFSINCDDFTQHAKKKVPKVSKSSALEVQMKRQNKQNLSRNIIRDTRWSHIIDFRRMCQIKYLFVKYLNSLLQADLDVQHDY